MRRQWRWSPWVIFGQDRAKHHSRSYFSILFTHSWHPPWTIWQNWAIAAVVLRFCAFCRWKIFTNHSNDHYSSLQWQLTIWKSQTNNTHVNSATFTPSITRCMDTLPIIQMNVLRSYSCSIWKQYSFHAAFGDSKFVSPRTNRQRHKRNTTQLNQQKFALNQKYAWYATYTDPGYTTLPRSLQHASLKTVHNQH